ncbi:MAG: hypothetical protein V9F06_03125 [Thermomicrobiales bacterium]
MEEDKISLAGSQIVPRGYSRNVRSNNPSQRRWGRIIAPARYNAYIVPPPRVRQTTTGWSRTTSSIGIVGNGGMAT